MISYVFAALLALTLGLWGAWLGWFISRRVGEGRLAKIEELSKRLVQEAEKEAEIKKKEAILEAKDEWYKAKLAFEREIQNKKMDLQKLEKKLQESQANLDRKVDILNKKDRDLQNLERVLQSKDKGIKGREAELEKLISERNQTLERISGMSSEDAKRQLMENLMAQARQEAAPSIKQIREEAEQTAH